MNAIRNSRLLAVAVVLGMTGVSRAEIIIRAGPVRVRVGQGVSVEVRPGPAPARTVMPAPTPEVPVQTPEGVPLEIAPPAQPVPLPGADTTRRVSDRTPTIYEFAASFKPSAGTHEAVVMHPYTNAPVKVSFTLPDGSPSVKIKGSLRRAVEFRYGSKGVEIWFFRDGRVQVIN